MGGLGREVRDAESTFQLCWGQSKIIAELVYLTALCYALPVSNTAHTRRTDGNDKFIKFTANLCLDLVQQLTCNI